jgi:hypothetical protein
VIAVVHLLVAYFFSFPCIEIEDLKLATYWSQEHRKGIGLTTMLRGSSCLSSGASKSSRAGESTVVVVTFQGGEASLVATSKEVAAACWVGGRRSPQWHIGMALRREEGRRCQAGRHRAGISCPGAQPRRDGKRDPPGGRSRGLGARAVVVCRRRRGGLATCC